MRCSEPLRASLSLGSFGDIARVLMIRILVPLTFLVTQSVWADGNDSPGFHFFAVPSQANTCYAVHSVRPWTGDSENISRFGRIQLFRAETGKELWHIDDILCSSGDVFPADDLKHLVIIRCSFPSRLIESIPVILFHADGKLIKSHTLRDLAFDTTKLERSVSSSTFVNTERRTNEWNWEWPLISKEAKENAVDSNQNPRWLGTILEIHTLDGQRLRFEGSTGKLLEAARPQ